MRGGASHETLVPLHLPLLSFFCFFLFFFWCVCVCVCCITNFTLYITRGAPNKAVKKKTKTKTKRQQQEILSNSFFS